MPASELGVLRPPSTVLLGAGAASQVGRVAAEHGTRTLLCTDSFLASSWQLQRVLEPLERAGAEVHVLALAEPELPLATVEAAIEEASGHDPECVVGLGGGSCLDLAKLVALGLRAELPLSRWYGENAVPGPVLPVIALPTTAGTGSEVTPVAVLTDPERELKVGISSHHLIPKAAICDFELTLGAPATVTAHSGIDALAHAIEAYCAVRRSSWEDCGERIFVGRNTLSDAFALRAVELIGGALVDALDDKREARAAMMEGSLCAGLTFASAGTALAHALQYPIGARTHTPHGLGIGLLLPFTMAFNATAVPGRTAAIGAALGVGADPAAAVEGVRELALAAGIPGSLLEIGVEPEALPEIAAEAIGISRLIDNNPRPVGAEDALAVLAQALHGGPPALAGNAIDREDD